MYKISKKLKILISTGISPPAIGGPSQYAKSLEQEFTARGNIVVVKTYGKIETSLPLGVRHLYYFFKIIPAVLMSDFIIVLDTFSVGVPTILASKIFFKKVVVRTGGDFLWESYVERTGDLVLLSDFYKTRKRKLNLKEQIIFYTTKYILKLSDVLIFSTKWQQDIFNAVYALDTSKQKIIENCYEDRIDIGAYKSKNFVCAVRSLKWKNIGALKTGFYLAKKEVPGLLLDDSHSSYQDFLEKLKNAYAVILVSLGDISPNMILEAISFKVPFILTRENGLMDRIKDIGIFVDPKDINEIKEKIIWLSNEKNRKVMVNKMIDFKFRHSYKEIADEFMKVFNALSKTA